MRIVHVEDFIHPDAGYQVNILSRLQVEQGHEVSIVTAELDKIPDFLTAFFGRDDIETRDRLFHRRTGVTITRVPLIGFYSGRAIFHPRIFRTVDDLRPDVLFVHGEDTLTGMQFIVRSLWQKYPMILDCHMLEMASVNRFRAVFRFFYKRFITPIILRNRIPLVRVVDSDYVEKCLGLPLDKTTLLSLGTDTSFFRPDPEAGAAFRARHGVAPDEFIVLYAGKLDQFKGGGFFAESLERSLASLTGRNIRFVIVGNAVGEYGQSVERILARSENSILRFPTQAHHDLLPFYQAADIAVFPRHCSLSFFDVQSCGVPVVLEENDVNMERLLHANGLLFRPGDSEDLRRKIVQLADMQATEFGEMQLRARAYVKDNFDYVPIAEQFTAVLQAAVEDFGGTRPSQREPGSEPNQALRR